MTWSQSRLLGGVLSLGAGVIVACTSVADGIRLPADAVGLPTAAPTTGAAPPPPPAFDAPCPAYDPPRVGSDCTMVGKGGWDGTCEYGHDIDRACNDVYECSSGVWRRLTRPACIDRCPSSFDEIVPGAHCPDVTMGCSYLEGTCACVPDEDAGAGDAGPDAEADPLGGVWRCAPPPRGGCPAQRPPIGGDCVRAMTCDYGACALGRDLVYSCLSASRRWVQSDYPDCE